jgi:hypothetical protein
MSCTSLVEARRSFADGELFSAHGEIVGTGLQLPASRPETFARFNLSVGSKSVAQITELLNARKTSALEWFPAAQFIFNQLARSSCNGWAAAGALSRSRFKQGMPYVALSGADLYCRINGGRDAGSMLDDGMKEMFNGIAPASMVDPMAFKESEVSIEAKRQRANFRAAECHRVDDELELAAGLAMGFIGVIAVHYSENYNRLDSHGVAAPCPGPGNHAVGVEDVRWRNNRFEFGEFNSHGLRSGNQGRRWLTWKEHLAQTNQYHAFYLIRAAHSNPDDNAPG